MTVDFEELVEIGVEPICCMCKKDAKFYCCSCDRMFCSDHCHIDFLSSIRLPKSYGKYWFKDVLAHYEDVLEGD